MKFVRISWLLLIAILMAACSTLVAEASNQLSGTEWELLFIRKSTPIAGSTITIAFADGEVRGSTGCNTFFGSYQAQDGTITFSELAATLMACPDADGIMRQEREMLAFL